MRLLLTLRKLTRALARLRGGRILTGVVRKLYSASSAAVVIHDLDGDLSFECHLGSHIGSQIFWDGSYSTRQLRLLHRLLRSGHVFLDIGANEGEQTLFASKRLTAGRVVAFEPSTPVAQRLEANVARNGFSNVTIARLALSDRPGELPLYLPGRPSSDGTFNEGQATLHRRQEIAEIGEIVPVTTLDSFLDANDIGRIDVMKIDVEGAEYDVIRGAEATLRRDRPLVILEVNDGTASAGGHTAAELLDLMRSHGYEIFNIGRSGRAERMRSAPSLDVICVPTEKLASIGGTLGLA